MPPSPFFLPFSLLFPLQGSAPSPGCFPLWQQKRQQRFQAAPPHTTCSKGKGWSLPVVTMDDKGNFFLGSPISCAQHTSPAQLAPMPIQTDPGGLEWAELNSLSQPRSLEMKWRPAPPEKRAKLGRNSTPKVGALFLGEEDGEMEAEEVPPRWPLFILNSLG